jgi:tetratricopeptide (TPR) repeat protein
MSATPRRRGGIARVAALGLLGLLLAAPAVRAQPPTVTAEARKQAIQLTNQANPLLYLGKYAAAIALFKQAVQLDPQLSGAWRNLGLAYEGIKDWKLANEAYEKYLDIAGTGGKFSLKVMARVNECRKELGLPPKVFTLLGAPGNIELKVNVSGAAIAVDGIQRGSSPTPPFAAVAGLHLIQVTREGYRPWSRSIGVQAGQTVTVVVTLEVDPRWVPPRRVEAIVHKRAPNEAYLFVRSRARGLVVTVGGRTVPRRADGAYVIPPGETEVEVQADGRVPFRVRVEAVRGQEKHLSPILPRERTKRSLRLWGWVTLGAAAVLAGTGAVFGALENSTFEDVRNRRADSRAALDDLVTRGKAYRGAAIGLYAGAAAVLISTITLFALERRGENPAGRPLPLVVAPVERGTGLAVSYSREVSF